MIARFENADVKPILLPLIASLAIGAIDNAGLLFFGVKLDSFGMNWIFVALLLWAGLFGFGVYRCGVRGLWLLLGLPLVLLPYAALVVGAGMI